MYAPGAVGPIMKKQISNLPNTMSVLVAAPYLQIFFAHFGQKVIVLGELVRLSPPVGTQTAS